MSSSDLTPEQEARNLAERTRKWPEGWGPFHRHFANDAIHRDGGPECAQPGSIRRVYVFDSEDLNRHERFIANRAVADERRRCPSCGNPIVIAPRWQEWACSDPDCRMAHGDAPGGGWLLAAGSVPVATPPAEPAAPRLWPCEHGERGWHRTDDNRHCLGGAAPSQPWSDPDHDVAGDMRRAASGLSAAPRPALCEHGSTGSHFESIASQRYGGWCPGPTCEHGQTKPHSFQKLRGGFHYGCPGPVSVPKESSDA